MAGKLCGLFSGMGKMQSKSSPNKKSPKDLKAAYGKKTKGRRVVDKDSDGY